MRFPYGLYFTVIQVFFDVSYIENFIWEKGQKKHFFLQNQLSMFCLKKHIKNQYTIGKFAIQCTDYKIYILFFTLTYREQYSSQWQFPIP